MDTRRMLAPLGIILVLLLCVGGYLVWQAVKGSSLAPTAFVPTTPLLVHHTLADSQDSYSGSLVVDSPCKTIAATLSGTDGTPTHITIALATLLDSACTFPPRDTTQAFKVALNRQAATPAPVIDEVVLNGAKVDWKLVEGATAPSKIGTGKP